MPDPAVARPGRELDLTDELGLSPVGILASGLGTATNGELSRPMRRSLAMIERPSWTLQPVPTEPA